MKTLSTILYRRAAHTLMVALSALSMFTSCEPFLEVDEPFGQLSDTQVFKNEALATSAITTVYSRLRDDVLLTGNNSGLGTILGLYADELDYYGGTGQPSENFYAHTVLPSNTIIAAYWNNTYNVIYRANAVLEGIENSTSMGQESKDQLQGEALFIRALCHFYLVNLFGEVPYVKTTDYRSNSQVGRMPEAMVYTQIVSDLQTAKSLLSPDYITSERTRPNAYAVSALLARVHLYDGAWQLAEQESSQVIGQTARYQLETNLQEEFLKESTSTIWHLKPRLQGFNSNEATTFIFNSGPPPTLALTALLVTSMETDDLRKSNWMREISKGTSSWYHAHKYRSNQNTGTSVEYSIVFRLSEQLLIRSEARAMLGDLTGALADLNTVRDRAGLGPVETSNLVEFRELLLKERRHELFTEHGHRWFDLKRMGLTADVIAPIKPGWSPSNVLLPVPESELLINPNLQPQNTGY